MSELVANWHEHLSWQTEESLAEQIHTHIRTGRPLGADAWVRDLEARLDRRLRPHKRGPKPRPKAGATPGLLSASDTGKQ